ncbi:MAG: hypothetical protein EBR82_40860 [Caulobacteraceae bacterium]|nr:hypothetical protein [Caulobacteraceae bacterium]
MNRMAQQALSTSVDANRQRLMKAFSELVTAERRYEELRNALWELATDDRIVMSDYLRDTLIQLAGKDDGMER